MSSDFRPRAALRARWLVELSTALEEAQALLSQLAAERIGPTEADGLRLRVEELRTELRSLRRRGFAAQEVVGPRRTLHPDWQPRRD